MSKLSKYVLITKLHEMGLEAEIIDGIPYVLNASYGDAAKAILTAGYDQSWGVRSKNISAHISEE